MPNNKKFDPAAIQRGSCKVAQRQIQGLIATHGPENSIPIISGYVAAYISGLAVLLGVEPTLQRLNAIAEALCDDDIPIPDDVDMTKVIMEAARRGAAHTEKS